MTSCPFKDIYYDRLCVNLLLSTEGLQAFSAFFLKLFTNLKSLNNNRTNAPSQALQTFHDVFVFPFGCLSEPDL